MYRQDYLLLIEKLLCHRSSPKFFQFGPWCCVGINNSVLCPNGQVASIISIPGGTEGYNVWLYGPVD
jgi:hypothetical protein